MPSCRAAAGVLLDSGRAGEALPFAEQACAAKFEDGCYAVAIALFGLKRAYPRALGYGDDACKDETYKLRGSACNLAGAITLTPLGVKRDTARGIDYLEAACTAAHAEGCVNAAKTYRLGLYGVNHIRRKRRGGRGAPASSATKLHAPRSDG